jgi:hypothetical protein
MEACAELRVEIDFAILPFCHLVIEVPRGLPGNAMQKNGQMTKSPNGKIIPRALFLLAASPSPCHN